jgi:hypothetical protein
MQYEWKIRDAYKFFVEKPEGRKDLEYQWFLRSETTRHKNHLLSLLDNGSVKIPLLLLGHGSVKIPLSLLGNDSVKFPIAARQRLGKLPLSLVRNDAVKIPLSLLGNGSVKIPLSLLDNGSVKIPLSLIRNDAVKIPLSLLGNGSVERYCVTNTHATIEELLVVSFSMWPVSYQGK